MNIYSSENFHFVKEIFPNGFALRDFEEDFFQNQNILNDDRNIIKVMKLGEVETVIKSFKTPNLFQAIIYKFFRKSKAKRSFENSKLLKGRGVNVPEPLGYIEVFDSFRLKQSYFISSRLEYDFTLDFATEKKSEDYRRILKSFIHFTHDLHEKNILHLDYGVGNICIKKHKEEYKFFLVDLNRLRDGVVSSERGFKNLAHISKDPEINKILSDEYSKRITGNFQYDHNDLNKFVNYELRKVQLRRQVKDFFTDFTRIPNSSYAWDYHSNQPHTLKNKNLKTKIVLISFFSNLKVFLTSLIALFIILIFFKKNKEELGKEIDSLGLCVNLDDPIESQKLISNSDLIEMIDELSVDNILVRIPLADFNNIEKYLNFIKDLKGKDILVSILQDREHVVDKALTLKRLDFIFTRLNGIVHTFQIGNSINRKKWAFLSVDEFFSFFQIAYNLKKNKFPDIKLLGGNIIDFDIPFFARSIFHFWPIRYDGIATQLYVDRRGSPENRQYGFDTLSKIQAYASLAASSFKTSNEIYITEFNWPLLDMGKWAPAETSLIKESSQSNYLVRYFLLMLASGRIKKCYWHQLVAPGYGLINNLGDQIVKRDAYYCFKNLIQITAGGKTKKFIKKKDLFCLVFEKDNEIIEAIWSIGKTVSFKSTSSQQIFDMRGNLIDTKNLPRVKITEDVTFIKNHKNDYKEVEVKDLEDADL